MNDIDGKPEASAPLEEIARLRRENNRLNSRVAQLERMISLQPQSGLPTHFRLELELDDLIESNQRQEGAAGFCLLIIQLGDSFATVRKTMKSSISEWILYETGCRIQSLLGPDDKIFHTHESEFVLILPGKKDRILEDFLLKLVEKLDEPHIFSGLNLAMNSVLGAAYWPEHGTERSELLHHADLAAGTAVEQRTRFVLFKPELLARAVEKVELQNAMIKGLEASGIEGLGEQFALYFQPKVYLSYVGETFATVEKIDAEALLRWRHPEKGLLAPSTFIPLAEETGLILPLGKWLIYQAARRIAAWDAEGRVPVSISINLAINLSARQFRSEEAANTIASALTAAGISGDRLTVELTETSLFERPEETRLILERFAALGVKISVDDFGTGYSSLSHLHRFPLDEIKIDKLFIEQLEENRHDAVIVASLVAIAQGLGLNLVAEGIEKPTSLRMLWDMGCRGFQGYLIAKPLAAGDFIEFCDKVKADGMRIRIE